MDTLSTTFSHLVINLEIDVVEVHVEDAPVFEAKKSLVAPPGAPGVDKLQGATLFDPDQGDGMAALVFLTYFLEMWASKAGRHHYDKFRGTP